jgi:dienelactone hydrolase
MSTSPLGYHPPQIDHDPNSVHAALLASAPRRLAFSDRSDPRSWARALREAFHLRLGILPTPVSSETQWGERTHHNGYTSQRVEFQAEQGARIPAWLLRPESKSQIPGPAVICLQGHTTGSHISIGSSRYPGDDERIAGGRDFAVQAVRRGYTALALEQRCFGERVDGRALECRLHFDPDNPITDERCRHQSMVALLLGRTMLGERSWDVTCGVDLLLELSCVDPSRIAVMGHSGGGMTAYHAACLDPRIAACMTSGAVSTYAEAMGSIDNCSDNYLPGALLDFDLPDLAGLIAPRPLVVVSGTRDHITPIVGAEKAGKHIRHIYEAFGCAESFQHVIEEGGHRFYPEQGWSALVEGSGWIS